MTVEVLDAAYRLFRAGIFRCLPYSGLAVLVLELPTLYPRSCSRPEPGLISAARNSGGSRTARCFC
jgi:hypothetical protein